MKLRFKADQAELFRRGIDCPKSIVSVDVNPADLEPEIRKLISQHMDGIDVKSFELEFDSINGEPEVARGELIVVPGTSLDDLIAAIKEETATLEAKLKHHEEEKAQRHAAEKAMEEEMQVERAKMKQRPPATLKPPYKLPN